MNDIITDCLGSRWAMFYCPSVKISNLVSIQTLEKSIDIVNSYLGSQGRIFSQWDAGMQDEVARLFWVNWIYQRLTFEPIRKPVLTHYDQNKFIVDCGDTRLMSLRLYNPDSNVAVINTCSIDFIENFADWTRIYNSDQLRHASGFGPDSVVLATPAEEWCLSWLEIGDHTTSHHLHNVNLRINLLQNWVDQQDSMFQFSIDWIKSPIDWTIYQANCQSR